MSQSWTAVLSCRLAGQAADDGRSWHKGSAGSALGTHASGAVWPAERCRVRIGCDVGAADTSGRSLKPEWPFRAVLGWNGQAGGHGSGLPPPGLCPQAGSSFWLRAAPKEELEPRGTAAGQRSSPWSGGWGGAVLGNTAGLPLESRVLAAKPHLHARRVLHVHGCRERRDRVGRLVETGHWCLTEGLLLRGMIVKPGPTSAVWGKHSRWWSVGS